MKYIEVVKRLAEHIGIDYRKIVWLLHDADGLKNITKFEVIWEGHENGRPMDISTVVKKSEHPELFRSFFAEPE